MADFLIVDVGGANLAVEIDTEGASLQYDRTGIVEQDADDGSKLITQLFGVRRNAPLKSKWLTTDEFQALRTAAKFGLEAVVVGGEFIRADSANATPQTMSAFVKISQADFFADGDDFLHIAAISVEETL